MPLVPAFGSISTAATRSAPRASIASPTCARAAARALGVRRGAERAAVGVGRAARARRGSRPRRPGRSPGRPRRAPSRRSSRRGSERSRVRTQPRGSPARLAGELHGVLVGVGPAEREEDPPALEAGLLEQALGQARAGLGAPGRGRRSRAARPAPGWPGRRPGAGGRGSCTRPGCSCRGSAGPCSSRKKAPSPAGDGGGVPVGLDAPAVQDAPALVGSWSACAPIAIPWTRPSCQRLTRPGPRGLPFADHATGPVCAAVRTPFGRYGGALAPVRTDDLADGADRRRSWSASRAWTGRRSTR